MLRLATFSPCRNYRYQLHRIWDEDKPIVLFIMLNPSTADSQQDDPTIRRCINFAKSWGYGGLYVGNLYAFKSTDPKQLLTADDPIGKSNKMHLDIMASESKAIVCAWGNSSIIKKLPKAILPYLGSKSQCLKLSIDGTPWHPLYVAKDIIPTPFLPI